MNLYEVFTDKEKMLLNEAGINIENKNYGEEELKRYEMNIEEFIMSHSTKNNVINELHNQYNSILRKIAK